VQPGAARSGILLWPDPIGSEDDQARADGHKRLKGLWDPDHEPLGVYTRRGHVEGSARTGGIRPMVLGLGFGLIDTQAPWLESSPELAALGTPAASMDATHSGSAPSTLCVFCGHPGIIKPEPMATKASRGAGARTTSHWASIDAAATLRGAPGRKGSGQWCFESV